MTKMHENEFHIDKPLVHKLIVYQFPHWANLPLKRVLSAGTDNALYRLGKDKLIRLPRIDWAVENVEKEFKWLPKIAHSYLFLYRSPLKRVIQAKSIPGAGQYIIG